MIRFHTNAGDFRGLRIGLRRSDPASSRAWLCIAGQPWLGEFPVTAGRQADDSNLRSGETALFNRGGEHAKNLTLPNVKQHDFLQIDNDPSAQAEPSRGGCSPDLILGCRANARVEARAIGKAPRGEARQAESKRHLRVCAGSVAERASRLAIGRTMAAGRDATTPAPFQFSSDASHPKSSGRNRGKTVRPVMVVLASVAADLIHSSGERTDEAKATYWTTLGTNNGRS